MSSLMRSFSIRILTGFTIIRADRGHTSSSTTRPFSFSVEPVSTISTMTSESPTIGCKLDGTVQLNDLHSLVFFVIKIVFRDIRVFLWQHGSVRDVCSFSAVSSRPQTHIRHFPNPKSSTSWTFRPSSMMVSFPTTPISAAPYSTYVGTSGPFARKNRESQFFIGKDQFA